MTDASYWPEDVVSFDRRRLSRGPSRRAVACSTAVLVGVLTGACYLVDAPTRLMRAIEGEARPSAATAVRAPIPAAAGLSTRPRLAAAPAKAAPTEAIPAGAAPFDLALLDPGHALGPAPQPLGQSMPLGRGFVPWGPAATSVPPAPRVAASSPATATVAPTPVDAPAAIVADIPLPPTPPGGQSIPLPTPRPAEVAAANRVLLRPAARRMAAPAGAPAATPAPGDNGGFLEKFFGMLKPSGPALGYAAPEDNVFNRGRGAMPVPGLAYDRWTAVYDISAHTVFMPDGTRLEAHSGLGPRLDDPDHVHERNVGATPPHVYDLQPREQLFHGVQALRLNPVGGGGVFGRTGLLAHTYMLGPKGDSNGCVSFRDYRAFLQAYQAGQVRRLVVVARSM